MKANYTVKEGDLRVIRDEMTLVQLLLVAQNSDNMVRQHGKTKILFINTQGLSLNPVLEICSGRWCT